MIQIIVCEDDQRLLEYTVEQVREKMRESDTAYELMQYDSAKELMQDIPKQEILPTIAVLDIDLEQEEDGFRIAQKLRSHYGEEVIIIFMTSYSDYVFKCFDYEPLGFMRKKHLEEEIGKWLDKALHKMNKHHNTITFFKTNEGEVKIRENDIIYFEKNGKYVKIKTVTTCLEANYQLSELQDLLDESRFVMIYRSIVVNMTHVMRVDKDEVLLENGEALPLSRYRAKQVKEAFQRYL